MEFTKGGQFIAEYDVDSSQGGAFGLDAVLNARPSRVAESHRKHELGVSSHLQT